MIEVHERFDVPADPDTVWPLVSTPEEVVKLIPGAVLHEQHEDGSYSGAMAVQFGPARVSFNAQVMFERDDDAMIGRVTGRGKDSSGGTRARMAFTFNVSKKEGGGSSVAGDGEVDIKGPLAGMIEAGATVVIKRMLAEFSKRLAERCSDGGTSATVEGHGAAAISDDGWWRRVVNGLKARLRSG